MKVLFIGGTGVISSAVSKLAMEKDIDLWLINRGKHNDRIPKNTNILIGDINNKEEISSLLEGHQFDSIVQWISYTVEEVKRDVELFKEHTKQYVFISSASAYLKPIPTLPVTEDVPLGNKYWEYSENKKKCEEYLLSVHSDDFNVTIIRPSHTYNDEKLVFQLKSGKHPYTLVDRILKNKQIIIPDNGMELWTLTYNKDFAYAFLDILGNPQTYGEYYHLTSDKVYTWQRIYEMMCEALDRKPNNINIPTEFILKYFPEFEGELYGDKQKSLYFDNSKIKAVAPNYKSETHYGDIVKKALNSFLNNAVLQTIDTEFITRYENCISEYEDFLK
jgi:nucleoside-diphosphate-sugar epimerase